MGCPAKRVVHGWAGSALMRDLDHAIRLVRAVVGAVRVPVSLKMRLGWDAASINAPELARRAEAEGVRLVTVHGRTRSQVYKGLADWDAIAAVRSAASVPLVANGDCASLADARAMRARSGADAVMVGRAALGRPWLVGAIGAGLAGRRFAPPDLETTRLTAHEHYEAILAHYGVASGVRHARKHLAATLDDLEARFAAHCGPSPQRRSLRQAMLTSEAPARVATLLDDYVARLDAPLPRAA